MQYDIDQFVELIYSTGRVFDDLKTTKQATKAFLTEHSENVGGRFDYELLTDLKAAVEFICNHARKEPIDANFVLNINNLLKTTASMTPGKLRNPGEVYVPTKNGDFIPEYPSLPKIDAIISNAKQGDNIRQNAIRMFADLAKLQPFGDGNKRTALFTANGYLIQNDEPLLTIPTGYEPEKDFMNLLGEYYFDQNDQLLAWLAQVDQHQIEQQLPIDTLQTKQNPNNN